jgi:acyl carrier protein
MYKTGDLGRYLADGNVEFLGRMDHQVKIRGFRVELGEIEAVMADHPAVRSAAVVAHDDDAGGKYLVGYVVGQDGSSLSAGEVRAYLKERLPAYMVPASVVRLEWLPLTPQGKIDRRALLASGAVRQESEREFVAAETPIEKRLAEIWSTVLKVKPSVTDNFFELGGHSLLATQVISRLREAFRMDLPLRCLFEHPTIQGLAQWVEENKRDNLPLQMSAIVPLSRELHRTRRSL